MTGVEVVVGFTDRDHHTHISGEVLQIDEAYATTLIKKGVVKPVKNNSQQGDEKDGQ